MYGDPEDFGETNVTGYPHSWDLPASAIPRGNIVNVKGDPLTPLYPSIGKVDKISCIIALFAACQFIE